MAEGNLTKVNGRIPGEEGQTLAEYTMILAFIAAACVIGVTLLGTTIQGFYDGLNGSF